MAANHPATALYRARLATGRAGVLALLAAVWAKQYDPKQPLASLRRIGTLAGVFTVRAQASAVVQARTYLARLSASGPGADPFAVPEDVIGTSASGHPVTALTALAPAVYFKRVSAGQSAEDAGAASLAWLNRLAASEPYRSANATVTHNAINDDRFTGLVIRITAGNACDFCTGIADQGYTPAAADFAAHANCQCTAGPEVSP